MLSLLPEPFLWHSDHSSRLPTKWRWTTPPRSLSSIDVGHLPAEISTVYLVWFSLWSSAPSGQWQRELLLNFSSFTESIMMLHRITVFSFTYLTLICDLWMACSLPRMNLRNSLDFFPFIWWKHFTYSMGQSRKQSFSLWQRWQQSKVTSSRVGTRSSGEAEAY